MPSARVRLQPAAVLAEARAAGPDDLIGVDQVAALLSVSPETVRGLIARGLLPAYRPGRTFRVRKAAAVAYLESTATVPA